MAGHGSEIVEVVGEKILAKFCHFVDGNNYEAAADLFHDDGVLVRRGKTLTGKPDIAAAFLDRSPTLSGAHIISTVVIDPIDDRRASILAYLTVYHHDSGEAPKGPAPLTGPVAIAPCRGELEQRDGTWKLRRLAFETPVMMVVMDNH